MTFPINGVLDSGSRADENPLGNGTWTNKIRTTHNNLQLVANVIAGT